DGAGTLVWSGTTVVSGGAWSLSGVDLSGLPDGQSYALTADVSDSAGNPAAQASLSFTTLDSDPPAVTVAQARITSGGDDAEERDTGEMYITSSDLELAEDRYGPQHIGLRFPDLYIPQGAIITTAWVQFRTDEVSTGYVSLQIWGDTSFNAAAFGTQAFDISSRAATDARVSWAPEDWNTVGEVGEAQRTPDLAPILQEIVAQEGYGGLADVVLVLTGIGTRTADSREGTSSNAPLLHFEYILPDAGNARVAFDAVPDADATPNVIEVTAAPGTAVGITAAATDADPGDIVTYHIEDDRFDIDPVTGMVTRAYAGTMDFGPAGRILLTVTAESTDGSSDARVFAITPTSDVAFIPDPGGYGVVSPDTMSGAAIGITALAIDPTPGDSVTYSVDDARFAIDPDTGVITRSGVGTLDVAAEPIITLEVTATSSDGSTALAGYEIRVEEELMQFAVFGDYGDNEPSGEVAVAALVDSWSVDFILTTGDNNYGGVPYDEAIGQHYADYIGDYVGAYGAGSDINRFFPVVGNHEYSDGDINDYFDYFVLPDNERYFDFQVGGVHFFGLNSNFQEPDGTSPTSLQAQWYAEATAASNAAFNVTYLHHPPFLSDGSGYQDMRWDYEGYGADLVLAGHKHIFDLFEMDANGDGVSLRYVTTGIGGNNYTTELGANRITVHTSGMMVEFLTSNGALRDSFFIETPTDNGPLDPGGDDLMIGSAEADYLWGLRGDDTLSGGAGDDLLIGDLGDDHFVFATGGGHDVVADFVAGAGSEDQLDLRDFGIDSASSFAAFALDVGNSVVASFVDGTQITLEEVQVAQLHDDDFVSLTIA
ncbi:metallophosphoesterase, partial [Aestuariicoccus sp. MJ-SS9]|uniref:metallophosphoesterase n=1 Tax=Aestuariicoccus sp. MJ-SS9 TaxID=3079855 RepID=UPI002913889C